MHFYDAIILKIYMHYKPKIPTPGEGGRIPRTMVDSETKQVLSASVSDRLRSRYSFTRYHVSGALQVPADLVNAHLH